MFKKASKESTYLRVALTGPSGSGKSFTALQLAATLSDKIAAIDTERGSLSKYADVIPFDVVELTSFHPNNYIEAIQSAVTHGYEVLIIDSLSHEWEGTDGILQLVDKQASISKSNNAFAAWRFVTPLHNKFVNAILSAPIHVITTMRSKTAYVMDDTGGKKTPKKVGLESVQRDGLEYEFDIVGEMNIDNILHITKSRYNGIIHAVVEKPNKNCDMFVKIAGWLKDNPVTVQTEAAEPELPKPEPAKPKPQTKAKEEKPGCLTMEQARELHDHSTKYGLSGSELGSLLAELGYEGLLAVPESEFGTVMMEVINHGKEPT